ncbi:MAG: ATP-binding cassette domain-containing protein [Planctomycetes bacterium]|nr:ATP-binding cassette domain-containing protein [Planctomycetota bacterium]
MKPILDVRNLRKTFGDGCEQCGRLTGAAAATNRCPACGTIVAVRGASFTLRHGEILGVMGESGSGKSSLVRMLYFDEAPVSGSAVFDDKGTPVEMFALNAAQQRRLRNTRFGMVYQNAHMGLNFGISAGGNIAERLLLNEQAHYEKIRERARYLLERTGIAAARMDESPHRFSGGMQQRVQIARALATDPPLLLLDEVTTGLDVSVQARILDLILELQEALGLSMVVVTHDMGVIRQLATRTLVMKNGEVVEQGLTDQILEDPQHAYTQQLVSAAL